MPPKQDVGGSNDRKSTELIISLLIGLFFLAAVASALLNYIDNLGSGSDQSIWTRALDYFLNHIWPIWQVIAALVSVAALGGIIYNVRQLGKIHREERKIYNPEPETGSQVTEEVRAVLPKNEKWDKVVNLSNSNNPSDWRQAIIEADVMLDELLRTLGYSGESVGEMLKSVDKNDFNSLEDAWQAHKTRNAIAHSGSNFQLTEHETRRVISLFENVFREFGVIEQ